MTSSEADGAGTDRPRPAERLLATLPYVSLLGLLTVAVNVVLSFEDPHEGMLLASGLLLLVAPLGVLVHLAVTRELTRAEKRTWIAGLTGRQGMAFLAAYCEGSGRRIAMERLASATRGRRPSR